MKQEAWVYIHDNCQIDFNLKQPDTIKISEKPGPLYLTWE